MQYMRSKAINMKRKTAHHSGLKPKAATESIPVVLTKNSLAERVENLVLRDKMRYSEAVIHVCDDLGIDPIDIAKLITRGPLRSKIEAEAIRHNTIKTKSTSVTLE